MGVPPMLEARDKKTRFTAVFLFRATSMGGTRRDAHVTLEVVKQPLNHFTPSR
jgi:hypothetical protein